MLQLRDNEYSNRTLYASQSGTTRYIWAGYYLFVIVSSLIGDTTILIASIKYKAFKLDKIIIVIIQHIAVSDLMVTVSTAIPTFVSVTIDRFVLRNFLCYSTTYLKYYLYVTSLLLICNMTTCKALILKYPFRSKTATLKKAHLSCVVCWSIAISLPVTFLLVDKDDIFFSYRHYVCDYGFLLDIWQFQRPTLALVFIFIPSCHVIATTTDLLFLARQVARRGRETLRLQGIMTTALVALVYCLSALPYGVYRIGESFLDKDDESNKIFFTTFCKIAHYFLWLNTISNFYIYSLTVQSFRDFLWSKIKSPHPFPEEFRITQNPGEIICKLKYDLFYLPTVHR
jgi:hypothetical protein